MKRAPSPEFRMQVTAGAADVDDLRHVSNITYLRWVQEVAAAHSAAVGYRHEDYVALGAAFLVRRHEIDYLAEAFEGDRIELQTHVDAFRGASSERHTRIVRVGDGAMLAKAITLWAFVSRDRGRPTRIPKDMVEAFYREPATS